ncbi:hypothetical protein [Haloarcula laminariae]|uniref:hypothetical protein n=1 Tax=Haloarcula laminariae TaxID=2961577 RepID=UPI0021C60AEF|nr:hypothetical protein [Halomicroarcula laminariae]
MAIREFDSLDGPMGLTSPHSGGAQLTDSFVREIIQNRDSDEIETVKIGKPPEDRFEEDTRAFIKVILDKEGEDAIIVEDCYHERFTNIVDIEDIDEAAQKCLEDRLKNWPIDTGTAIEHSEAKWETVFDWVAAEKFI